MINNNLSELWPDLPYEALVFFKGESHNGSLKKKTLVDFLKQYSNQMNMKDSMPSPTLVRHIFGILEKEGLIHLIHFSGALGMNSEYSTSAMGIFENLKDVDVTEKQFANRINCMVYGFSYVYEYFKEAVVPIIHHTRDNVVTTGTGFFYGEYFITARHCIEGAKEISIKGVPAEIIKENGIYFHRNDKIDLAFIHLPNLKTKSIDLWGQPNILDHVITLGYPKVSGFHQFLTAETAQVSARLTVTHGQVSADGENYLTGRKLILITARIRGGNSGGPLLNAKGEVVGISVEQPFGQGAADDLGYGTAIPFEYLVKEMIQDKNTEKYCDGKVEFSDFEA